MTTLSQDLVLHGLPAEQELDAACQAQIAAMGRHWRLIIGARSATGTANRPDRISVLERIYRGLDLRIFRQGQWKIEGSRLDAPASAAAQAGAERWHVAWNRGAGSGVEVECLCLEFEGLPMAQLEQAVRSRLGNPGGTLAARVWRLHGTRAPTLLVVGKLCLDHKSLHRSVALCAAKVSTLLKSAIARIDRGVSAEDCGDTPAPTPLSARAQLSRLARSVLTRLWWRGQWQIEVLTPNNAMLGEPRIAAVLRPPDSAFWADPFLLCRGQRRWILFEELSFETNRGEICMVEIDGAGQPTSAPRVVLREPWHLSYPFLWQEGERLYMIPEAGQTGELTLYEAVGDAMQWQRRAALISGVRLGDATVVRLADRLWMFATCADHGIASMEDALNIYWADQIEGPWHPHALNPVKIDATCSRPAGSMHVVDGKLHRAVMDCSSTYGGSVRWMCVSRLTECEFEEHPAPSRLPNRELQAEPWHTFNAIDNIVVIDRFVRLARWRTR